jgi:hypothetical protein
MSFSARLRRYHACNALKASRMAKVALRVSAIRGIATVALVIGALQVLIERSDVSELLQFNVAL